jgi:hypothetical protein
MLLVNLWSKTPNVGQLLLLQIKLATNFYFKLHLKILFKMFSSRRIVDDLAIRYLYAKFMYITRNAETLAKKEFSKLLKGGLLLLVLFRFDLFLIIRGLLLLLFLANDKLTDCIWNVFVRHQRNCGI